MTMYEPRPIGGQVNPDPPLMSYAAGSPARTFPTQGNAQESQVRNRAFGERCSTPFAIYDRDTCWWRTSQLSLFEDLTPSSLILPASGSMRNGQLYERPTSARPKTVNGSTCWPTPRAAIGSHGVCWGRAENNNHRSQLEDFLGWMHVKEGGQRLVGYNVNPVWLDWLMGFPIGWTDLQPSETP